jgi:hypothetical protein
MGKRKRKSKVVKRSTRFAETEAGGPIFPDPFAPRSGRGGVTVKSQGVGGVSRVRISRKRFEPGVGRALGTIRKLKKRGRQRRRG